MKLTTLVGSGMLAVVLASPVAMAKESNALHEQEQARILEQNRQRLEQRFQNRSEDGVGSQYRYEQRQRHRSTGNGGQQKRYEEQSQQRSSGGQGGGRR